MEGWRVDRWRWTNEPDANLDRLFQHGAGGRLVAAWIDGFTERTGKPPGPKAKGKVGGRILGTPMNIQRCFDILDLRPGATLEEAKLAYKDIVNVWHPDRFSNNPRLRKKAELNLPGLLLLTIS